MKQFFFKKGYLILILIGIITSFWFKPDFLAEKTKHQVLVHDVFGYYVALPALLIHNDLLQMEFLPDLVEKYNLNFDGQIFEGPEGNKVMKYHIGLAIVYTPFFLFAHLYAHIFDYPPDGLSFPYQLFIILGMSLFCLIGIHYLKKSLEQLFDTKTAVFTVLILFLGTNLLNETTISACMAHGAVFSFVSFFIWNTIKWYENPNFFSACLVGFFCGFATMIRPTNAIIILFPVLYGVYNKDTLVKQFILIKEKYKHILALIVFGFIGLFPQLLYWKITTGSWIFYSYRTEGFTFLSPHLENVLFSFRKGWLIYTPLMLLIFPGLYFLWKKKRVLILPVFLIGFIGIWTVSSWYFWSYGGCFSQRAMVDFYPFFGIIIASLVFTSIQWNGIKKGLITFVFVLFCCLNMFQHWQFWEGLIHYDGMTKQLYVELLAETKFPSNYNKLLSEKYRSNDIYGIKELPNNVNEFYSIGELSIKEWNEFTGIYKSRINSFNEKYVYLSFELGEMPEEKELGFVFHQLNGEQTESWFNMKFKEQKTYIYQLPQVKNFTQNDHIKVFFWNPNKINVEIKNVKLYK